MMFSRIDTHVHVWGKIDEMEIMLTRDFPEEQNELRQNQS